MPCVNIYRRLITLHQGEALEATRPLLDLILEALDTHPQDIEEWKIWIEPHGPRLGITLADDGTKLIVGPVVHSTSITGDDLSFLQGMRVRW